MLVIDVQIARSSLPAISAMYAPGATVAFIEDPIRTIFFHSSAAFDRPHIALRLSKTLPLRSAYE